MDNSSENLVKAVSRSSLKWMKFLKGQKLTRGLGLKYCERSIVNLEQAFDPCLISVLSIPAHYILCMITGDKDKIPGF